MRMTRNPRDGFFREREDERDSKEQILGAQTLTLNLTLTLTLTLALRLH
jgi:hypothetical protein